MAEHQDNSHAYTHEKADMDADTYKYSNSHPLPTARPQDHPNPHAYEKADPDTDTYVNLHAAPHAKAYPNTNAHLHCNPDCPADPNSHSYDCAPAGRAIAHHPQRNTDDIRRTRGDSHHIRF